MVEEPNLIISSRSAPLQTGFSVRRAMQDIITGKVAAIIDDTTLVLNLGSRNGVQEGMVFVVFAEYQEIQDPDSGEALGKWEMVKARVVVDHVQDRMCTACSPLVIGQDQPGTLSAMMVQHSLGHYGQRAEERERLQVRASDIGGRPQTKPIAVGDRVRSLPLEDKRKAAAEPGGDAPKTGDAAEPGGDAPKTGDATPQT